MDPIDLNIILGESNPDGRGSGADIPLIQAYLKQPFPAVRIWNPNTVQLEPLEFDVNNSHTNDGNFGPELQYATRVSMADGVRPSAMVKVTRGSSGLDPAFTYSWDPTTGVWFTNLITRVNAAIAALTTEGWTVNIRSINCSLGLNDADNASAASNFETRFQNFVNRIYSDLSIPSTVPFVMNQLHAGADVAFLGTVITAVANVAAVDSRINLFSVDDMQLAADLLHWEWEEEIELGNRFYDNFS